MYCSKCGEFIPDNQLFCGGCGSKVIKSVETAEVTSLPDELTFSELTSSNSKGKKENNKKRLSPGCSVVLFLALFAFMIICFYPGKEEKHSSNDSTKEVYSESVESQDEKQDEKSNNQKETKNDAGYGKNEISLNESTYVDDFECKIDEINWYADSDFDYKCVEKESGYEYIVICLSARNTTEDTKNAPMLNMLSADGQQCTNQTAISLYKSKYKINFGATMANTTAYAYTIYKIPEGAKSFKLQILSNGFGSNSKYFVFNRNDIK